MNIQADYWPKPGPQRGFDWTAIDADHYCGCEDCRCIVGYGATEQAAIDDLQEQMAEQQYSGNLISGLVETVQKIDGLPSR